MNDWIPQVMNEGNGEDHCSPSTSNDSPNDNSQSMDCSPFVDPNTYKNLRFSHSSVCSVCGDKPTGFHYDVLSCNGCKTFFRRTLITGRVFKCTKGGKCQFNKDFRCSCRACRFTKCHQAGMNPKRIIWPKNSEDWYSGEDDEDNDAHTSTVPSTPKTPSMALIHLPKATRRQPATEKEFAFGGLMVDLLEREFRLRLMRNSYSLCFPTRLLSALNRPLILGTAYSSFLQKRDDKLIKSYENDTILHWMVSDQHLLVEYAKSFKTFRELSLDDQYALIAHVGSLQLLLMQSIYSVQSEYGTTTFPDGIVAAECSRQRRCANVFQMEFTPFIIHLFNEPVQLLRDLRLNEPLIALLRAILLFSPESDKISDDGKKIITEERNRLCDAMSMILLKEHGIANANKYVAIHSVVQKLQRIAEWRRRHVVMYEATNRYKISEIGVDIFLGIKPEENK